jgi:hypothetical protein
MAVVYPVECWCIRVKEVVLLSENAVMESELNEPTKAYRESLRF